MNASLDLAQLWLRKAENDLITARQTLLLPGGPTDTVAFHAQQAAEKALKALLTFEQVKFPKVHDLVRLLELVLPLLPELQEYRRTFAEMADYSVLARYPDELFEPSREEVLRSLAIAEEVVGRVRRKIPSAPAREG